MTRHDLALLAEMRRLASSGEARRRRIAAGLTLAEVAAACGVRHTAVLRWETGARRPRGRPALTYARLLRSLAEAPAGTS